MRYTVEVKWNRTFHYVPYCVYDDLDIAIRVAKQMENMGDGERVKGSRIVDENGKIVWIYGKLVETQSDG